jgi:membrane-associated phospholipid phosphatase
MRIGPVLGQWLEWTYLLCYPLVPAAFAVVWTWSDARDVERLWVAVLIAGFACYGALPWTAARPPRLLVDSSASRGIAIINAHVLHRMSHGLNTFPSGHVAVSGAAALAVASVSTQAGVVFAAIAVSIAAAAVVGRYHYLVDVVIGGAVACAAWGIALLIPLPS